MHSGLTVLGILDQIKDTVDHPGDNPSINHQDNTDLMVTIIKIIISI